MSILTILSVILLGCRHTLRRLITFAYGIVTFITPRLIRSFLEHSLKLCHGLDKLAINREHSAEALLFV